MGTLKSGENRICPNCGIRFYVKPFIAKKPNRGKYCSNKCQHEFQKKLGIPNPGAFKSKPKQPKICVTCKSQHHRQSNYCSKKCLPKRSSKFTQHRLKLLNQNIKQFKWHGLCGVCKKANQIYYVSVNMENCKKCHNRKTRIARIKRCKEDPIFKMQCYIRTRITDTVRKLTKNKKQFSNGSFCKLFGCSNQQLKKHLESKFTSKMSWDNYGTYWHLDHIIPISSFDLSDPDQCKAANHWTNLQPLEASKNMSKSNKIINPQPQLMLQC